MSPRTIVHVDMDAFFASVEQRDDPALRGRPVAVGGRGRRSVVAAASYEARTYGVRSAMPMSKALRLCPQLVVVPPRFQAYQEASQAVFTVFDRYTPLVEGLSIDEAFLDVSGTRALFGDGIEVATRIKREIKDETELTASAGVAPNKFVAKIASDLRKPDGLVVVASSQVRDFLAPLPVSRMWGVGAKTEATLRAQGIDTFGDLLRHASDIEQLHGERGAEWLARARGEDHRPVIPEHEAKSIGAEETFAYDLDHHDALVSALAPLVARVCFRLTQGRRRGSLVRLKYRFSDFTTHTRQVKLAYPACDRASLMDALRPMVMLIERPERGIRLLGVSVADFAETAQVSLLPDPHRVKCETLEETRLAIQERFGQGAIR